MRMPTRCRGSATLVKIMEVAMGLGLERDKEKECEISSDVELSVSDSASRSTTQGKVRFMSVQLQHRLYLSRYT